MSELRCRAGEKSLILLFVFVIISGLALVGISLKMKTSPELANIDNKRAVGLLDLLTRYQFDHFGKKIEKDEFAARPTLLLVVNAKKDIDLLLFHRVFAEWNERGLNLVIIANGPGAIYAQPVISSDGVWILSDESREISSLFDLSNRNSSFILFDGIGNQIATGDNTIGYEQGVRIHLLKAFGIRPPLRRAFAPVGQRIEDIDWLRDMKSSFANSEGKGFILLFLNAFCETCNSRAILERLRKFATLDKTGIRPILVLSSDFTPRDRSNFEARYEPGFPVVIASKALADKQRHLHEDYFHAELNNIMVLVSNKGEIVACADAECACYQDLLIRAEEMLAKAKDR